MGVGGEGAPDSGYPPPILSPWSPHLELAVPDFWVSTSPGLIAPGPLGASPPNSESLSPGLARSPLQRPWPRSCPCPRSGPWLPGPPAPGPGPCTALSSLLPRRSTAGPDPSPAAPGPASSSNRSGARTDGSGDIGLRRRTRVPGPMAARRDPPSALRPPSLGSGRVPSQPQRRQLRRSEAVGRPAPSPGGSLRPARPRAPRPSPGLQGPCPPSTRPLGAGPRTPRNSGRPRGRCGTDQLAGADTPRLGHYLCSQHTQSRRHTGPPTQTAPRPPPRYPGV